MTPDPLIRLLLRLAIAYVALQIAGLVVVLLVLLGGGPPLLGDVGSSLGLPR